MMKKKREVIAKIGACLILGFLAYCAMCFAGVVFGTPGPVMYKGAGLVGLAFAALWYLLFSLFGILAE